MLEYRYDTQLLIDGHDLDEDVIKEKFPCVDMEGTLHGRGIRPVIKIQPGGGKADLVGQQVGTWAL